MPGEEVVRRSITGWSSDGSTEPAINQSSIQHSRNRSARRFPSLAARSWPLRTAQYIVVFPQLA